VWDREAEVHNLTQHHQLASWWDEEHAVRTYVRDLCFLIALLISADSRLVSLVLNQGLVNIISRTTRPLTDPKITFPTKAIFSFHSIVADSFAPIERSNATFGW
jgi:hypothetical protein